MLLTSNVKSFGNRCGICDLMNFSVTCANSAASSFFPESTRHLIRSLNGSRADHMFLCERMVTQQVHWDNAATYSQPDTRLYMRVH